MVLALRRRRLARPVHFRLLDLIDDPIVRVSYLELSTEPGEPASPAVVARIALERLSRHDYLQLYRRVGAPVRWDQRLQLSDAELDALLAADRLHIHVLRDASGQAVGLAEFDCCALPNIELKNFGLVPEAQGRGLGRWLLATSLRREWAAGARRIRLHTDSWDHPAAMRLYREVGFVLLAQRDEAAGPL